jgi:multidrug efflux pump subunit AcrA (membrane-fusion protein)
MRTLSKFSFLVIFLMFSCKQGAQKSDSSVTEGKVPVTVTNISIKDITETIDLNATSVFMLKTFVKSPVNGYLQEVNVQPGDYVTKGCKMFIIRSKESQNLGNTIVSLDSTLHFSGLVHVTSPGNGYVTQLTYRSGDYVQDGETLAAISDAKSLVFMLELPYELKPCLPDNKSVSLTLPDGQKLTGTVSSSLPAVDPVSQTQNYVVRVSHSNAIPENLIARVHFIKKSKIDAITLPKAAILTNEVQSEFWIMKMTGENTAVKVPVTKGIETSDCVEILSPILNPGDKILLTGNYGLPDTARVVIEDKTME